jgi:hypothetical protein
LYVRMHRYRILRSDNVVCVERRECRYAVCVQRGHHVYRMGCECKPSAVTLCVLMYRYIGIGVKESCIWCVFICSENGPQNAAHRSRQGGMYIHIETCFYHQL